jgi:hypothetical protein
MGWMVQAASQDHRSGCGQGKGNWLMFERAHTTPQDAVGQGTDRVADYDRPDVRDVPSSSEQRSADRTHQEGHPPQCEGWGIAMLKPRKKQQAAGYCRCEHNDGKQSRLIERHVGRIEGSTEGGRLGSGASVKPLGFRAGYRRP